MELPSPRRFKILVVDDDVDIREGLSELLKLSGYEVHTASSTFSALAILERESVDLVITDILMPGESGLSLIQEIHGSNDKAKIICISGGGRAKGSGLLSIAQKFGASRVLSKPISGEILLDTVEQLMHETG